MDVFLVLLKPPEFKSVQTFYRLQNGSNLYSSRDDNITESYLCSRKLL